MSAGLCLQQHLYKPEALAGLVKGSGTALQVLLSQLCGNG